MREHRRRAVLGAALGLAAAGPLTACSASRPRSGSGSPKAAAGYVSPNGPEVAAAERRRHGGAVHRVRLTATGSTVDLGGPAVRTWTYGGRLPGQEIRTTAGGTLEAVLANHLPQPTTVHWHGLALRNDMDGVPDLTQRAVPPGAGFTYRFAVPEPGTYWLHPHVGVQADRGLYAPLVVEDPREPLAYDHEWVIVLDDWLDGVDGSTPDAVLAGLSRGMGGMPGMGGMDTPTPADSGMAMSTPADSGMPMSSRSGMPGAAPSPSGPDRRLMGARSELLGGDAGDVAYPYYLVNGRVPTAPTSFSARPGDRIRLRIVNAGGDTAFRVALGGHRMTVTHTDGRPVAHETVDALLLGMGERYDVLVTAGDGVFPLVALAEGKGASGLAVLRTGSGTAPDARTRPAELNGRLLTADRLRADASVALSSRAPDVTVPLTLTGGMASYDWGIDGKAYDPARRVPVTAGQRVRLTFRNATSMWHPVHLHGHSFALPDGGPRKDTVIVLPGRTVSVDFDTDNPGLWMLHCHNAYHAQSGMMTVLGYRER
ncbi:multicopper oxidase family protein [Streptomyces sp. ICBB 8177]|uniref:multicopper oxidase family protein n=1 Tax=Streptomyces sp. ICBB 8177 TaxID=563922 RepID=UPI000D6838DF|nr:multicopper oxidase family protein [Streptomyces sp. ICBB 8177]PWI43282.1 copper oxidase [Streptomyces sp. ICBB 8177]